MKHHYHIYVDDRFIETIYSGWPVSRIMSQMRRKYPDFKSIEVRKHEPDESTYLLRGSDPEREFYEQGGVTPEGRSV